MFKTKYEADSFLSGKQQRKIPSIRSTYVYKYDDKQTVICYHETDVIAYYDDGIQIHTPEKYKTVTTKRRMNSVLIMIGAYLYQKDYIWYVVDSTNAERVFETDAFFNYDGTFKNFSEDF
jgi:hypothetical protein